MPEFQRVRRLDIVVTVNEDGWLLWIDCFLTIHDGMACCGIDFGFVDAGLEEVLADRCRAGLHIGLVFAAGADGRDAQEVRAVLAEEAKVFYADFDRLARWTWGIFLWPGGRAGVKDMNFADAGLGHGADAGKPLDDGI